MLILITGITGRISSHLAAALLHEGHTVRGLVWPRDPQVERLHGLEVDLQYGSLTEASKQPVRSLGSSNLCYGVSSELHQNRILHIFTVQPGVLADVVHGPGGALPV